MKKSAQRGARVDHTGYESDGCKKIVRYIGADSGRSLWEWVCKEGNGGGVTVFRKIRGRPFCRRCAGAIRRATRTIPDLIGTSYGCKVIVGHDGVRRNMDQWHWQCSNGSGQVGTSSIYTIREEGDCRKCTWAARRSDPSPTPGREILGRDGAGSGGQRFLWRCLYCGKKGSSYRNVVKTVDGCTECSRKRRVKFRRPSIGEEINGRVVLEDLGSSSWFCQCSSCARKAKVNTKNLHESRCRCHQRKSYIVGDRGLTVEELSAFAGRCTATVVKRIKDGWTPLEIILGERSG